MTALKPPSFVSIEDYLTISSQKVLVLVESDLPRVLVYRRRAEGGFGIEEYNGIEAIIELLEVQAALPLQELYDGIKFVELERGS